MRRIHQIRENERVPLRWVVDYPAEGNSVGALIEEILAKSEAIRRNLGLRESPLGVLYGPDGPAIVTRGIVGVLELGGTQLEIVPKFTGHRPDSPNWRLGLLRMLARARRLAFDYTALRQIGEGEATLVDHLALAFAAILESAYRGGPIVQYQVSTERSPFLRGRLSVSEQVLLLQKEPALIVSEVAYLDPNNDLNRLLRWAGEALIARSMHPQVKRRLGLVVSQLPPLSISGWRPLNLPAFIPGQFGDYRQAIEIAHTLARGYGGGIESGRRDGYGYVLDMAEVFEGFIERSLASTARSALGGALVHVPQHTALLAISLGQHAPIRTRPDNTLMEAGQVAIVIDAKYKDISEADSARMRSPPSSDIYQLCGSMIAHRCRRGLLIYPSDHAGSRAAISYWTADVQGVHLLIAAAAIDLSSVYTTEGIDTFDENLGLVVAEVLAKVYE